MYEGFQTLTTNNSIFHDDFANKVGRQRIRKGATDQVMKRLLPLYSHLPRKEQRKGQLTSFTFEASLLGPPENETNQSQSLSSHLICVNYGIASRRRIQIDCFMYLPRNKQQAQGLMFGDISCTGKITSKLNDAYYRYVVKYRVGGLGIC